MNILDIIIASLLLFGFVRGLMKGLLVEVASLVALITGVYGAIHFSFFIENYLVEIVSWNKEYIALCAFVVTFICIVVLIAFLGKLLTKLADVIALGILNKILGGVFGALKICLILSVIFVFFVKVNNTIPFVKKEIIETSILFQPVKNIVPTIFPSIFDIIKK